MKSIAVYCCSIVVMTATLCLAQDSLPVAPASNRVLFVSDKTDKPAKFFMDAFTEELTAAGVTFSGNAVDAKSMIDDMPYATILVYSQVMAFNNISPVSAWVKAQKSLKGIRLFIFVTANRWFYESRRKKLGKLVKERGGEVVDAVTMATNKMTAEGKRKAVRKMVNKVAE